MAIIRECDLCKMLLQKQVQATYDAKTMAGPWAYVCDEHLKSHCYPHVGLRTQLSMVRG